MSELYYDADGHAKSTIEVVGVQLACFGCGCDKPNACWIGTEIVGICSACARDILPSLYVDAIAADPEFGPSDLTFRVRHQIPKLIGSLWERAADVIQARLRGEENKGIPK